MGKCRKEYDRKYYQRTKEKHNNNKKKLRKKNLLSWLPYLPKSFRCEVCNRQLKYFSDDNFKSSIFFDHKNTFSPIKDKPKVWLFNHYATPKNIAIWKSCNFGILCCKCNLSIPTKNRKEWLNKVTKYIDGKY